MVRYHEIIKESITMDEKLNIEDTLRDIFRVDGEFKVNNDGIIDIEGGIYPINDNYIDKLPIRFGKVTGVFNCQNMGLKTLNGCPTEARHFLCRNNDITSLIGAPTTVGFKFDCGDNLLLTSLEGAPKSVTYFVCDNTSITSFEHAPLMVLENFTGENNQKLISAVGLPKFTGGHVHLQDCPNLINPYDDIIKVTIRRTAILSYYPTLPLLKMLDNNYNSCIEIDYKDETIVENIITKYNTAWHSSTSEFKKALIDCQYDLIKAGFKGNAKW